MPNSDLIVSVFTHLRWGNNLTLDSEIITLLSAKGYEDMDCPKCHTRNPDDAKFCAECATPLKSLQDVSVTKTLETPAQEPSRGTTFAGRYKVIEKLGTGGMTKLF
jgi:hypothetical protein